MFENKNCCNKDQKISYYNDDNFLTLREFSDERWINQLTFFSNKKLICILGTKIKVS